MDRKVPLNGGAAYREGFELSDNPFDMVERRQSYEDWSRMFKAAQKHQLPGKV